MSDTGPSLNDVLKLVARALPEGMAVTSGSPIQIQTSDGAIVVIVVEKHPWDDAPHWKTSVEAVKQ